MKRSRRKYLFLFICLVILCIYFKCTATPTYKGRLTIDINNMTFSKISNVTLEYESANTTVILPDIKPLERMVVLAPKYISDSHLKTRVFIHYNGEKTEMLGEYHTLTGGKYNADYAPYARVKIKKKQVMILQTYFPDWGSYFNIKPYFCVIDMDETDK